MPESRERILDTAFELVREQGAGAVTMGAVAEAAGLSRQMVYVHFRSRAGLLTAMARDHDRRSGFAARVAAARELPPVEAFERLLREWLAYVPEILSVARALEAAAIAGEAGGSAWRDRMDDLHAVFGDAVARVAEAGLLAPGWTPEAATDWAWARVQPGTWDHLVVERGWHAEQYTERTVRSLLAEIVRSAGVASPRR